MKRKAEESVSDEDNAKTINIANVTYNHSMDMNLHIYVTRESPISLEVDTSATLQTEKTVVLAENLSDFDPMAKPLRSPHPTFNRYIAQYVIKNLSRKSWPTLVNFKSTKRIATVSSSWLVPMPSL